MMVDRASPRIRIGQGQQQREDAGQRPAAAASRGPLIADIYCGEYPRSVSTVVRIRAAIHLRVEGRERPTGEGDDRPATNLPASADGPTAHPVPTAAALSAELAALLAADAARAAVLDEAAVLARSAERAARRLALATVLPVSSADTVHQRVRTGRLRVSPSRGGPKRARVTRRPPEPALPVPVAGGQPRVRVRRSALPAVRRDTRVLVVGGLLTGMFIGSMGMLARLPAAARPAEQSARAATGHLLGGLRSLWAGQAAASSEQFQQALGGYRTALQELDGATTALQRALARLDPKQRLPAATTLLAAGEELARSGTDAAALITAARSSGQSLTESVAQALPRLEGLAARLARASRLLAEAAPAAAVPPDLAVPLDRTRTAVAALERGLAGAIASHEVLLELLGASHDRQYLILFQNNRELRPTGGFIGSFALVDMVKGEVRKVQVESIYNPDGQLKDVLVPPRPLQNLADRWYARDANWFADFRVSARKVAHLFERSGGPSVDGVLAVTPTVLEDLLRLTGPVPMPAYDVTVTAENVLAETQRLVTYEYDRTRNEPKAFLADLLPEVLARLLALPRERWGELGEVVLSALQRKHLLVYFSDPTAQEGVRALGWGGALPPATAPVGAGVIRDHLGRFEANIGGHKTDDRIDQTVEYDLTMDSGGALTATLVVTRYHRGPNSGTPGLPLAEDPARKANIVYERTFVPPGSALLEARGFTPAGAVPRPRIAGSALPAALTTDDDLQRLESTESRHESGMVVAAEGGWTTFGGWVVTEPEETTVTVLRYRLPGRLPRPSLLASILRYQLLLTHQPGHRPVLTRGTVRLPEGFRVAWSGPPGAVITASDQKAVFSGHVDRDLTWGAVIEEK